MVPQEVRQIRQDYPQLAFPIDDKEVFDHRDQQPLQTVFTSETGRFSFDNMLYGEYIVAYRKEGWGYNYRFGVLLNGAELDLSSGAQMALNPEITLPGYIDGVYQLESNRCYVANSDVVLSSNAQLFFKGDARLLLKPYVKISSQASIVCPESSSRAYITSYAGIHTGGIGSTEMAEGMVILNDAIHLRNISFSFLRNALKVSGNEHSMERLSFVKCVFGLVINAATAITIDNSFFYCNTDVNAAAHYGYDIQNYQVRNCLYYGNYIAIKHELVKNTVVENNAFVANDRGFLNLWESVSEFRYNYISSSGVGVENSGQSNLEMTFNDIEAEICVKTYPTGNWVNLPTVGWTKANNNNFNANTLLVSATAVFYSPQPVVLDFAHNYWGTTNTGQITQLIIDHNDLPPPSLNGGVHSVISFEPIKQSLIESAGVQ